MPYASPELLALAAKGLRGAHNFTVLSIPALLHEAKQIGQSPTSLIPFGSASERAILDRAFALGNPPSSYLSVWSEPPAWMGDENARRGVQAQRTRDAFAREVFIDDAVGSGAKRKKFGLIPTAGTAVSARSKPVRLVDLALWLGRRTELESIEDLCEWFHEEFPLTGTDLMGTLYLDAVPDEYRSDALWIDEAPSAASVLEALDVRPERIRRGSRAQASAVKGDGEGFEWTRSLVDVPLPDADIARISERAIRQLRGRNVILPDAQQLVRRCVVALLSGHLVLQGPPGTGKTTLARVLAEAFSCDLEEATATSEWTPYNVVGGYRVGAEGFQPHHGHVTRTVLQCAEVVKTSLAFGEAGQGQLIEDPKTTKGVWLLIDEFNRADIDKAIGSLYTLLGSSDPDNLASTPIDLWFEEGESRKRIWAPGRFRIIGAMNDLDTTYVNRISQGLTRRFQFITVGVPQAAPTASHPVTGEVETALVQAHRWVSRVYGRVLPPGSVDDARAALLPSLRSLTEVVTFLRAPGGVPGWPVGTAQIVDVIRALLLEHLSDSAPDSLDRAVADRLVPQMGAIDDEQFEEFHRRLEAAGLLLAAKELSHLIDPHVIR